MKKFKTIMIAIVAAFTVAGMSNVGAAAGSIKPTSTQNLTITRTITNAKNDITNTFGYTITASSSNPKVPGSDNSGVTGFPTTASVVFTDETPSSGIAEAQGTIDMTGATFSVNGDYEWTVTETSSTDSTNYPVDSTNSYKIKASVRNSASSNLSSSQGKTVTFFVFKVGAGANGTDQKLDLTQATGNPKAFAFTSETAYEYITIEKEVTGNMADVDKYFTVTVTLGEAGDGTFTVSGNHDGATSITAGTPAALTLKHGETITIGYGSSIAEIPQGMHYSYTESDNANYTPTITVGSTTLTAGTASSGQQTVDGTHANNVNKIVNDYETNTITGAFLKVLPYVVIVAIAAAGVVYLVIRNKKQKAVEE